MAITVKKLISELEKIDNKFLEIEVYNPNKSGLYLEIDRIQVSSNRKKVIIFIKE